MAYDEELAMRLRELLQGEVGLSEKKMVLVRVDPADSDRLIDTSHAQLAVMRGRPMEGWLRVAPEHLRTKRQLARWTDLGVTYARSLPD
jgi:hypothetical protein